MNAGRILALFRRVTLEVVRDRPSLALLFIAPLVMSGLITFIIREGDTASYLVFPVVMQWNFWLSQNWSVFGEPGLVIYMLDYGGDEDTYRMCVRCWEEGVFVNPIVSPAVEPGNALLRLSLMATHTEDEIPQPVPGFTYSEHKVEAERLLEDAATAGGPAAVILRGCVITGPGTGSFILSSLSLPILPIPLLSSSTKITFPGSRAASAA